MLVTSFVTTTVFIAADLLLMSAPTNDSLTLANRYAQARQWEKAKLLYQDIIDTSDDLSTALIPAYNLGTVYLINRQWWQAAEQLAALQLTAKDSPFLARSRDYNLALALLGIVVNNYGLLELGQTGALAAASKFMALLDRVEIFLDSCRLMDCYRTQSFEGESSSCLITTSVAIAKAVTEAARKRVQAAIEEFNFQSLAPPDLVEVLQQDGADNRRYWTRLGELILKPVFRPIPEKLFTEYRASYDSGSDLEALLNEMAAYLVGKEQSSWDDEQQRSVKAWKSLHRNYITAYTTKSESPDLLKSIEAVQTLEERTGRSEALENLWKLSGIQGSGDRNITLFYLLQAKNWITRLLRSYRPIANLSAAEILQVATWELRQVIEVGERFLALFNKKVDGALIQSAKASALSFAKLFPAALLEQQTREYHRANKSTPCYRQPYEGVFSLFFSGLESVEWAEELTADQPFLALQEEKGAYRKWVKALKILIEEQGSGSESDTATEAITEKAAHLREVLEQLRQMERIDRQPFPIYGPVVEEEKPW